MVAVPVVPPRIAYVKRNALAAAGVIAAIWALTVLHILQDRAETRERAEERARGFATVTQAYVLRRVRETESGLRAIGEVLASGEAQVALARAMARSHRQTFPFIAIIADLGEDGVRVLDGDAGLGAVLKGMPLASNPAGAGAVIGEPVVVPGHDVPVIPLVLGHRSGGGRTVTMVAAIRSDVLGPMHRALNLSAGHVSAIVNARRVVLAREPFVAGTIGLDIRDSDPFGGGGLAGGRDIVEYRSPVDGLTYLLGLKALDEVALTVRGGELIDSVMLSWRNRSLNSCGIATLLSLLAVTLCLLSIRQSGAEWHALAAFARRDTEFRLAMANLTEGVVSQNPDGSVRAFNPAALDILGLTEAQLRGRSSMDPEWRARGEDGREIPGAEHPVMRAMATGEPHKRVVMELSDGRGARRWVEVNATPIVDDGKVTGAVASFADVTERRAAQERVEELNRTLELRVADRTAQLHRLSADLAAAEDRERRQIARDLHDDIAQILAAARIRLAPLLAAPDDGVRKAAHEIADMIARADASTRSLAAQLAPPVLDTLGVVPAIEWLVEEFHKLYGLSIRFERHADKPPLGADARMILYRAVRELLINVSKHAGVDSARVVLGVADDELVIEVIDGGEGFSSDDPVAGLGLRGMRESLARIDARLTIESGPGGTRARIFVPIARNRPKPVAEAA